MASTRVRCTIQFLSELRPYLAQQITDYVLAAFFTQPLMFWQPVLEEHSTQHLQTMFLIEPLDPVLLPAHQVCLSQVCLGQLLELLALSKSAQSITLPCHPLTQTPLRSSLALLLSILSTAHLVLWFQSGRLVLVKMQQTTRSTRLDLLLIQKTRAI